MKYILILALFVFCTNHYELSMFYCGFSQAYCGQSVADDVYDKASFVILAFANTIASGAVVCDTNHFPAKQIQGWKRAGKKVLISVGGQNGNWTNVFATETHRKNFITSFTDIVYRYDLDGVDLDIQQYSFTPRIVAQTIIDLRAELNKKAKKIIIVSP